MFLLEFLYLFSAVWMAVFGLNSLYLLWLYLRSRGDRPAPANPLEWPQVTVQLPIYNEGEIVIRLLEAVSKFDYPADRLEVQVLDDSDDQTSLIISTQVEHLQKQGLDIEHIQRPNRKGFKAGALAEGIKRSRGEFFAIFDADFVPPADFLKKTLPWFDDQIVGCVQARWGHTNRNYSLLTRLEAMAIDGHFIVEQTARSRNGHFLNFNGTAGVWRGTSIQDAGGWLADTLTEDLDLSYRAQLKGWRIEYLPDLVVPAELPVQMAAFKRQQARWAKGSLQTVRKIALPLIRSRQPVRVKIEGMIHISRYFVHPLVLAAILLALPLNLMQSSLLRWVPFMMVAAVGPPLMYLVAQAQGGPNFWGRFKLMPWMVLLGIGLAVNNSRAAIAGLLSKSKGTFLRTPKFSVQKATQRWETSLYALGMDRWVLMELLFGLYALILVVRFAGQFHWGFVPSLLVYFASFGYVAGITFQQGILRKLRTS